MASEAEAPEISSVLERLLGNRDLPLFTPFLFGFTNNRDPQPEDRPDPESEDRPDSDPEPEDRPDSERIYLINPSTQSMVVIEGASALESLLRDLGRNKGGQPPASKASIEALPTLQIKEQGQCVICLDECEIGSVVTQLPCKHTFHPHCIQKWLRIHGWCPVCRHKMPQVEERGTREMGIWVGFSFTNPTHSNPTPSTSTSTSTSTDGEEN